LPTFEVASVKPNKSGENFVRFGMQPGGRFTVQNAPVIEVLRFAYAAQPFQIEGGPAWIRSDRFDITARGDLPAGPPVGPPPGQLGPVQFMTQALLADRFKLKVRRESKEMPIYALVLARSDGRLGKQLEPSKVDCAALAAARGRGGADVTRGGGPGGPGRGGPPPPPAPGERPRCGIFGGFGSMGGGGISMEQVALVLSQRVNRVVVDKTGLTGLYEFTLEFTPEQLPPPGTLLNGQAPQIDPNGPSIFTALQEQLGLKLDSQRGPVEMLVIDNIEPPTPD
jgi:uncharacterized protein (TIGR03435 family)